MPAESEVERAERQAEAQFQELVRACLLPLPLPLPPPLLLLSLLLLFPCYACWLPGLPGAAWSDALSRPLPANPLAQCGTHYVAASASTHSVGMYCLHVPPDCTALQELMDLPHASTQDLEAQRRWEQAGPEGHAGNAAIEGDAPVAGGGLQVGVPAALHCTALHCTALHCTAQDLT